MSSGHRSLAHWNWAYRSRSRKRASRSLDALDGLNAGDVAPIMERNSGRRGEAPELSAKADLGVLKWIRWQHGLGRTVEDALEAAAEVLGITSSAIKQWPKRLEKVFGEERVASELELAEKVGRWEAEGKTIRDLPTSGVRRRPEAVGGVHKPAA